MKPASLLAFPAETATPVSNSDLWVMCLEHTCVKLDPIQTIVRESGKPARSLRLEPELPVDERFGKRHGRVAP